MRDDPERLPTMPAAPPWEGGTDSEAPVPATQRHPFRFTGSTPEFFRIWIVSALLTLVTFGAYSAWAKVRKRRYLYAHTWVAGANFDYHANPKAILRSRLIALVGLGAYSGLGLLAPWAAIALLAVVALLVPWIVLRALAFGAASSSYRNLRFRFRGRYRDAARAIGPLAVWPLVVVLLPDVPTGKTPLTSGPWISLFAPTALFVAAYPYMVAWRWRLRLSGTAYGSVPLACEARTRAFYRTYLVVGVGTLAMFLFALLLATLLAPLFIANRGAAVATFLAVVGVVAVVANASARARVSNLALGATRIGEGVRVVSDLAPGKLAGLYLVNAVAVACSLGLLVPWAVVRTARYRTSTLALDAAGDLDGLLGDVVRDIGATGEELAELFAFDFSL